MAQEHHIPVIEHQALKHYPESEQFSLNQITREELVAVVMNMPSNKSPGMDKVTTKVIKDCLFTVSKPLTEIINLSFTSNTFPTAWKIAEVVPHVKDGDGEVASNNRPISLLVTNSKICERIVFNQLSNYLEEHNRLTSHQSGNKCKHSTESVHLLVTDHILNAIDEKKVTILVLLDLSKAFDSIDHDRLLHKLQNCGISSNTLEWFRSYLTGRMQAVRIGAEISDLLPITKGVPQGSILGPLLFNLFINDLPCIPLNSELESYVDDSKPFLSFCIEKLQDVVMTVNNDLFTVATYLSNNCLLANPDKTKIMFFGTQQMLKHIPADTSFTFLGKTVQPVQNAKDLGLIMDPSLSFDEHIKQSVSSCIKNLFRPSTLEMIIQSYVFSKLFYCSTAWSSTSQKNICKPKTVQNFAARIITGSRKYDHVTPALKQLKWLPVENILYLRDCVMTYKCINKLAPDYTYVKSLLLVLRLVIA